MPISYLSPEYQIVIPKEICKKLAIEPGQGLSISEKNGRLELPPVLAPRDLVGFIKTDQPLTFDRESDRDPL